MQRTSRDSKPSASPRGANDFQGFKGYSVFAPTTRFAGQWTVSRPTASWPETGFWEANGVGFKRPRLRENNQRGRDSWSG
jgi:hypothetical protein